MSPDLTMRNSWVEGASVVFEQGGIKNAMANFSICP